MDEKLSLKEIKKRSRNDPRVIQLDDGRFVFFGMIYNNEEELRKGIEDVKKTASFVLKITKPKSWKIVKKIKQLFKPNSN